MFYILFHIFYFYFLFHRMCCNFTTHSCAHTLYYASFFHTFFSTHLVPRLSFHTSLYHTFLTTHSFAHTRHHTSLYHTFSPHLMVQVSNGRTRVLLRLPNRHTHTHAHTHTHTHTRTHTHTVGEILCSLLYCFTEVIFFLLFYNILRIYLLCWRWRAP